MSVVPPEFGNRPALSAANAGIRRDISLPQLRDAFPPRFAGTFTSRPLSAAHARILLPILAA